MMDIKKMLDSAHELQIAKVAPAVYNRPSFGLVKSTGNGTRAIFSTPLVSALQIKPVMNKETGEEELRVQVKPCDPGTLLIAQDLGIPDAYSCVLKGSGRKVAYNSQMVDELIEYFKLDYSKLTSNFFQDIQTESTDEGVKVATVVVNRQLHELFNVE